MVTRTTLPLTEPGEKIPQMVRIRRNMTRVAILEDPIEVVLKREEIEGGEAGGFNTNEDPIVLSPQIFRLYSYGRLWDINERESRGGTRRELLWSILGMYNAEVERSDYFDIDTAGVTRRFEVRFARPQTMQGHVVSKQIELRELT